jgi:hypothetical protein
MEIDLCFAEQLHDYQPLSEYTGRDFIRVFKSWRDDFLLFLELGALVAG